jgi:rod shape-determining protein MreC
MENFFSRYKNPLVLMLILFIQVVALATQVKRAETGGRTASSSGGTRLIRVWTVTAITPVERVLVSTGTTTLTFMTRASRTSNCRRNWRD